MADRELGPLESTLNIEYRPLPAEVTKELNIKVRGFWRDPIRIHATGNYMGLTLGNFTKNISIRDMWAVIHHLIKSGGFGEEQQITILSESAGAIKQFLNIESGKGRYPSTSCYGGSQFYSAAVQCPNVGGIILNSDEFDKIIDTDLVDNVNRVYVLSGTKCGDSQSMAELNWPGGHGMRFERVPDASGHENFIKLGRHLDEAFAYLREAQPVK